jgi:FKBP-type peptidyl-prolyl cis-trans isomerases 1
MKKLSLLLIIALVCAVSVDAKSKKKPVVEAPPAPIFINAVDSMSYALGVNLGLNFGQSLGSIPGGASNIDLLIKGFSSALKGDSTLMTADFAEEYFGAYITKMQKVEAEKKQLENAAFLIENKTKEGVVTTESGLQYQVIVAAEGAKPIATDYVRVHYEGFLLDGTKFDSSVDRGEPIVFRLDQVIAGWTEGVQLMSEGAKYKFFIPYNLAYGEQGAGGVIPPYATLIFEVELFEIIPAE